MCEQAKSIVWPLLLQYQYELEEIDIAVSDELIEQYGIRIPVLKSPEHGQELNWPFDSSAVEIFFGSLR